MPLPPDPRQQAHALLNEWTLGESLRKHALAVAFCTESYAPPAEADTYFCAGLLHDMDYERHPSLTEHPFIGVAFLREHGWPEEILHAILAHADYSGTPAESPLDRALFACDELSGFLTACALVKPTKSIHDVEVKGVLKKLKDKAFARAVNRQDITHGAELLAIPLEDHITNCLQALQQNAAALNLQGTPTLAS